MTDTPLGRLIKLKYEDLRKVWPTEAGDFTPWLAQDENIKLLGDTIGLDLEVEGKEKNVGPFRADILCKETANDTWVLVENQLERTDHSHLGQLLTYAAGLNAVTIVWLAERFTDEHRAALDWLNEVTSEEIAFFGLEIELWRIGESPIAPKFNLVSFPNDWIRRSSNIVPDPTELSANQEQKLAFWTSFRDYIDKHPALFKTTKPLPQHWMNISIGRSGFKLNAIASLWDSATESYDKHEIRAELELTDENAKKYFVQLEKQKAAIESELGEVLTWYNPDKKKTCRIYLRTNVDLNDRSKWANYHAWLKDKLEALQKVFAARVKNLDADVVDMGE